VQTGRDLYVTFRKQAKRPDLILFPISRLHREEVERGSKNVSGNERVMAGISKITGRGAGFQLGTFGYYPQVCQGPLDQCLYHVRVPWYVPFVYHLLPELTMRSDVNGAHSTILD
jgi:hypothetical protein